MRPILTYDLLRELATRIEDLSIENQYYKSKLINLGISPANLESEVLANQQNKEIREAAHANFAQMWKLLDEAVTWFVTQDLSEQPPPTDKQN